MTNLLLNICASEHVELSDMLQANEIDMSVQDFVRRAIVFAKRNPALIAKQEYSRPNFKRKTPITDQQIRDVIQYLTDTQGVATNVAIAKHFDVSPTAIRARRKKLDSLDM